MAMKNQGMGDRVKSKMQEMKGKAEKMMGGKKTSKTADSTKGSAGKRPGQRP
jgi:hypothetical protein